MKALSWDPMQAVLLKLKRLSKRVSIKSVDALFDEMLAQIPLLRKIVCTQSCDTCIVLNVGVDEVAKVDVDRARSVLRMMCARLAVRCSEWASKEVSPHGGHVEFLTPRSNLPCIVEFKNSPESQTIEISANFAF